MLDKFKIGHYEDDENGTGVTVILSESSAIGGVSVRGAAPATRETDLLANGKTVQRLNSVVLSGGSAFGLEASCGVMKWLKEHDVGYNAGKYNVPIVAQASLYDLEYKNFAYPDMDAGYKACQLAKSNNFVSGNVGAGTGATISKVFGGEFCAKGGLGVCKFNLNNLEIAVIVAVNALGDIVKDGNIISGAKNEDGSFMDCKRAMSLGSFAFKKQNTTIGCILTNAILTKEQANSLCELSHDGFAVSISPPHTPFDGDAMFLMSSNEIKADITMLGSIIPDLTAKAIQSVAEATEHIQKKVSKSVYSIFNRLMAKNRK